MMRNRIRLLTFLFLVLITGGFAFSQQAVIDSLQNVLKKAGKSEKPDILHQLCRYYFTSDNQQAEEYAQQAISVCEEIKDEKKLARALNDLAKTYFFRGEYNLAEKNFMASLDLYRKTKDNNGIAGTLNNIGVLFRSKGDYEQALKYYQESLGIKKKLQDEKGIANTLNNIGEIYKFRGDYPSAIENYLESFEMKKKLKDKPGMANTLNNLGEVYSIRGEYEKALGYYLDAAALWDELKNISGTAGAYHNIGEIYSDLENYDMAGKYYKRALELQKQTGDVRNMAYSLRHLGEISLKQGKYDSALVVFNEALTLEQRLENKPGVATTLEIIGQLYFHQGNYREALDMYRQALDINQEIGNKKGVAAIYNNMGETLLQTGNPAEAIRYYMKSNEISRDLGILGTLQNNYLGLARAYQYMGDYKTALENYFEYQSIKDTLLTEQIHKQIAELETRYQTQQKEKEIQLKDAELMRKDLEIKQQNLLRNAILTGMILVILLAGVIYRSYRQKRKANEILTRQKAEIEQKNIEITDSIRYAQHIQNAFLPHQNYVHELFQEVFVYYKPKDIVSGDFYWFGESRNYKYVAAVDATGHGVPGAFISLLGYNLLNNILKENPGCSPAVMLDELNRGFSDRMFKSYQEHSIRDSMDIALVRVDTENNQLSFAGAYNPLWLIRDGEMTVIKGDKFPIGSFIEFPDKKYREHSIKLLGNEMFYVFSDGYADQFGGEKGKKFMYRQLKDLLLSVYTEEASRQKEVLEKTMEQWRGDAEQVDDQLIIGIRIV